MPPHRVRLTSLSELQELLEAFTRAGYLAVQARRDVIEIHRTPTSADPQTDLDSSFESGTRCTLTRGLNWWKKLPVRGGPEADTFLTALQ